MMQKSSTLTLSAALGLALAVAPAAHARKPRKPAQATAQTVRAVEELMGEFKWGADVSDVQNLVIARLRAAFDDRVRKSSEQWEQQKLRDELEKRVKEIRDSYVKFEGQKTPWDVSLIDKEFAARNDESVFYVWEEDQRRFFFFYQGKLYKTFIALSLERFKGKTFQEFANLMMLRYGPAEARFAQDVAGQSQFDRLEWPPSGVTALQAVDHTSFYGNYCLVLFDGSEFGRVAEGRKVNSAAAAATDPLLDDVLSGAAGSAGPAGDDDVVDRITGKRAEGVARGSDEEGMAGAAAKPGGKSAPGARGKGAGSAAKPGSGAKPMPKAGDNPLEGIE
ncbi:MAG: hypothetical protein AABZ30_00205 [Myxococcota bacterium]